MTRELFEEFFKLAKSLKKPIVMWYTNGVIVGTDNQFASVSLIQMDICPSQPYIFYLTAELSPFMKNISTINGDMIFTKHSIKYACPMVRFELKNRLELYENMCNLYNSAMVIIHQKNILSHQYNIQEKYYDMLSMKSSEGSKLYNLDGYMMSSFNAIHPVNKTDKVDVIIREHDEYSYTGEFIIHKKQYDIHEFLRFRYL